MKKEKIEAYLNCESEKERKRKEYEEQMLKQKKYINDNNKAYEEQLKELFKECGENFTIRIAKDRYGKSKG